MNLENYIASIPNHPKEGVLFRDITPLMSDGEAFRYVCKSMEAMAKECGAELIVGPESRGFIFGCPVACNLGIGFIPVRKPHKLPRETIAVEYALEYGTNTLEMHKDAIVPGQKVMIIDDLLATGGTIEGAIKLVEQLGGVVVGICALIELKQFNASQKLRAYNCKSLLSYD